MVRVLAARRVAANASSCFPGCDALFPHELLCVKPQQRGRCCWRDLPLILHPACGGSENLTALCCAELCSGDLV